MAIIEWYWYDVKTIIYWECQTADRTTIALSQMAVGAWYNNVKWDKTL